MIKHDLCDSKRVDELSRLVIPKNFCRLCNINTNDFVDIYCNEKEQIIYIKKKQTKDYLINVYIKVFEPVYKTFGNTIIITDKEKIIKVYGDKHKQIIGNYLSSSLTDLINDENNSITRSSNLEIVSNYTLKESYYYFPIRKKGFNVGSILVLNNNGFSEDLILYIEKILYESEI